MCEIIKKAKELEGIFHDHFNFWLEPNGILMKEVLEINPKKEASLNLINKKERSLELIEGMNSKLQMIRSLEVN